MEGQRDQRVLAYAGDVQVRYGIAYEIAGNCVRLVVPSSRRFIYRLEDLTVPAILILYAVGSAASIIFHLAEFGFRDLVSTGCGLAQNLFMLFTFAASAWVGIGEWIRQVGRKTAIELDEHRFVIHDHSAAGKPRTRWWPRIEVEKVLTGPVPWTAPAYRGLGLHICISGKGMVEVMPGHSPEVAQWVADRLNEALRSPVGEGLQRTS